VGTLLYSKSGRDNLQLYLKGGAVNLSASFKGNVISVKSGQIINHNNLTEITVKFKLKTNTLEIGLLVGSQSVGEKLNFATSVTSFSPGALYLGGVPRTISPPPESGSLIGYVGCIRNLQLNGNEKEVFADAVSGQNVAECQVPACSYAPCRNNGTCVL
jgi:hypothetical protein